MTGGGTERRVLDAPTGTVTFLFTDIVGSTRRWERDAVAMAAAVARHDGLLHAAIAANGGTVFKTIGDAFCAAFSTTREALAAALAIQRAIGSADFHEVDGVLVRIALHTGVTDERDGDYFGPTVNRVARLLGIAHGGQIVVSGVTADLARDGEAVDAALVDLGAHRLRDLERPERVFQLVSPDLPRIFPALRSLDAHPNNLPQQLSSFVGRETEVAEVGALLERHRLVTLIGTGGIGKTRVALQASANVLGAYRDGVWFVDLAPVADASLVPQAIATSLGARLADAGDGTLELVRTLAPKACLLILDNCEHLIDAVARIANDVLRGAPDVSVLATSRQGLGIAGEAAYHMPSLAAPAAIALFVERARATDARFALTDANAPIVADICDRLDGIALAIELAAVRVKLLGPAQLSRRLDERFRLLTGGSRTALPRQQTLHALIDWSYDLLDARERTLFAQLSVFAREFSLDAATGVCADESLDEFALLDVLSSLVDKSLVVADVSGDDARYRMLESVRAYAREKLASDGASDAVAGRHLAYAHDRFVRAAAEAEATGRDASVTALETILTDARNAIDWGIAHGEATRAADVFGATALWQLLGLYAEGESRAETLLAKLDPTDASRVARLAMRATNCAGEAGRRARSLAFAGRAVAAARASGEREILADTLQSLAHAALRMRDFDAADAALAEAERVTVATPRRRLSLLETRGYRALLAGELVDATAAYEASRDLHRRLGNAVGETIATLNVAEAAHARGETDRAIAFVRETLPRANELDDRTLAPMLLANLAGYALAVDDVAGARDAATGALARLALVDAAGRDATNALEHLALAAVLERPGIATCERATRLLGYCDAAHATLGYEREHTECVTHERLVALLRDALAPQAFELAREDGARLSATAALAIGLAQE